MREHIEYYFKFKELTLLHRTLGFGNNPPLPEVFTQNICRKIYDLEKWDDSTADAKNSSGHAIEIKATGSTSGTTTIDINAIRNLGQAFGGLYWLYFDFELDEVEICFIEAEKFKGIEPAQNNKRNNITLSKYVDENTQKERYRFERSLKILTNKSSE